MEIMAQDEIEKLMAQIESQGEKGECESEDVDVDTIPSGCEIFDYSDYTYLPNIINIPFTQFTNNLNRGLFDSLVENSEKDFVLDMTGGKRNNLSIEKHPFSFTNMIKYLKDPGCLCSCPYTPYNPITKELTLLNNDKIYLTLNLRALNYILECPLGKKYNQASDFVFDDVFVKPIQTKIDNYLKQKNEKMSVFSSSLYTSLDDLQNYGDEKDPWITICLPVFFEGKQFFMCISMKEKVLYKLCEPWLPVNTFSSRRYNDKDKMVIRMGEKNIEDDKIKEMKEGDLLDLDYTVGDDIKHYVNGTKKGWGKIIKEKNGYEPTALRYFVRNVDEEDNEGCNTYVSLVIQSGVVDVCKGNTVTFNFMEYSFLPLIHNKKVIAYVNPEVKDEKVYYRIIKKL